MMKILIILGFITLASSEVSRDKIKCSIKGPKYWCRNALTAKKCDAVSFCNEHIWSKKQVVSPPQTDLCTSCQQAFGTLHFILSNNETQEQVLMGMEAVCSLIPPPGKEVCTSFIDLYGKKIISYMVDYTKDPRNICKLLHLCSANSKRATLLYSPTMKNLIKAKVFGDYCKSCKDYMFELHLMLMNKKNKEEIVGGMKELCSYLPKGMSSFCTPFMSAMGERFITAFFEYTKDPSHLCAATGFCKHRDFKTVNKMDMLDKFMESEGKLDSSEPSPNSDKCVYCQQMFGTLHLILSKKEAQEQVLMSMKAICALLPDAEKGICSSFVDLYGEKVISFIVEYTKDPRNICKFIHFCSANSKKATLGDIPLMTTLITEKVFGDYCMPCKEYTNGLHYMLSSKEGKEKVVGGFKKVCKYLPSEVSPYCSPLVTAMAERLIDFILEYTKDPSHFCADVGLCKTRDIAVEHVVTAQKIIPPGKSDYIKFTPEAEKVVKPAEILKPTVEVEENGAECEFCTLVMGYLESMLGNNHTEAKIRHSLDHLCGYLPESMKSECVAFVNKNSDIIIHCIIVEIQPSMICEKIGLCKSLKKENTEIVCHLCKKVMGYLDKTLGKNCTEKEIKDALDKACLYLPQSYSSECKALVDEYSDDIIKLLVAELEPSKICEELGLCDTRPLKKKKEKNGIVCDVCKKAMGYLENILGNNRTEEEIKSALDKMCAYLPQSYKSECMALVDEYSDDIIKLLIAELEPSKICEELGLCNSNSLRKDNPIKKEKNGYSCELCKVAMGYIDQALGKNRTEEKVKKALDKLCSYLPSSYRSECDALVNEYSDELLKLLIAELEPSQICTELRLCHSNLLKKDSFKKEKNGIACELCTMAMGYLDQALGKNRTEEKVKKALDKVCSYLPSSYSSECMVLVNQYSDELIKLLIAELEPSKICEELRLCHSNLLKKDNSFKKEKNGIACELCTMAIGQLDQALGKNRTAEKVKKALDKVCSYLPSSYSSECMALVNQYSDELIKLLIAELEPSKICEELGLCSSTSLKKGKNGIVCDVCKKAMGYLENVLGNNRTEEEIKSELDKVCAYLPQAYRSECKALVNEYSDDIIKLLIAELEPSKICKELRLCCSSSRKDEKTHIERIKGKSDGTCEVCTFAMGYLESVLGNNRTEAAIKNALDKMCEYLPKSLESECVNFVNAYSEEILHLLITELQPSQVCKVLGLCTSSIKERASGAECEICTYAMGYLESRLGDNRTEEAIKNSLDKLCRYLPHSVKAKCANFVSKYSDAILNLLINELSPSQVCEELGLCTSVERAEKSPIGTLKGKNDGVECEICTLALGYLESILGNNRTEEAIRDGLDKLCGYLPKSVESRCMNFVNKYSEAIINVLVKGLSPSLVCKELGLCPSVKKGKNDAVCDVCTKGMFYLDHILGSNRTEKAIKSALDKMCVRLPRSYIVECMALVDEYSDEIIKLLVAKVEAFKICEKLGLCQSVKKVNIAVKKGKNGPICDVCTMGMGYLDSILGNNRTEEETKSVLDKMCDYLPQSYSSQCMAIVSEYSDAIIKLLIAELEPSTICKELGLCPSFIKDALVKHALSSIVGIVGIPCEACKIGIELFHTQLESNETKKKLKAALEDICTIITSPDVKAECTSLIANNYDQFYEIVYKETENADMICKAVKICALPPMKGLILRNSNGSTCDACLKSMKYLGGILSSEAVKTILHGVADQICVGIPFFSHKCMDLANHYVDLALGLIMKKLKDPRAACKALHACTDTEATSAMKTQGDDLCGMCLEDVKIARVLMNNKTIQEDIKKELGEICNSFSGFFKIGCNTYVYAEFDSIIKTIQEKLKDEQTFCQEISLCPESKTGVASANNFVTCGVCTEGSEWLASVLRSKNDTKTRIRKYILGVCSEVPKSYGVKCKEYVEQYYDYAYGLMLANLQNPDLLCQDIGMCPSSTKGLEKVPKSKTAVKSNTVVTCDVCELSMGYLEDMLKGNKTKDEVEAALNKLCSTLPYPSPQCIALVQQYSNLIVNLIVKDSMNPAHICLDLRLCYGSEEREQENEEEVEVVEIRPQGTITCELCKMALKELDDMVGSNRTKESVEKALDLLCDRIPSSLTLTCKYFVDTHAEQIVHYLVDELKKADEICKDLKLCVEVPQKQSPVKKDEPNNIITCELCEFALAEMEKVLDNNHTETDVRNALDKVCSRLPSSLGAECTHLVAVYADQIVHLLIDELKTPRELCTMMHLCSSTLQKKISLPKADQKQQSPSKPDGYFKCLFCKIPIELMFEALKGETSKNEIKKALKYACEKLPKGKMECEIMVKNYTDSIVDLIISGVDQPTLICKAMGYCDIFPANEKSAVPESNALSVNPPECQLCMFVVGRLDAEMAKHPHKGAGKIVKSVCSLGKLSKDRQEECHRLVDEYEYLIIKLLKNGKLTSLCKKVGMCVMKRQTLNRIPEHVKALSLPNTGFKCMICEYVVGVLDSYVERPATEAQIVNKVHTLCEKIPNQALKVECNALIGQYGDEIIEMFVENVLQPVEVCKDFNVC